MTSKDHGKVLQLYAMGIYSSMEICLSFLFFRGKDNAIYVL